MDQKKPHLQRNYLCDDFLDTGTVQEVSVWGKEDG